jgi:hypothetical protein
MANLKEVTIDWVHNNPNKQAAMVWVSNNNPYVWSATVKTDYLGGLLEYLPEQDEWIEIVISSPTIVITYFVKEGEE